MSPWGISIFVACVLGLAVRTSPALSAVSTDDEKAVSAFQAGVTKYLELKKKEVGTAPRSSSSAYKVAETQETLASKTKALRPRATQGEIFTPEVTAYFRKRISGVLAGTEGSKIRASLRHAEPVHGLALRVNEQYPEGVPLQSAPPSLLSVLPILPDSLEYRIVGRSLVLRDVAPNLVVDFISNALPGIGE